MTLAKSRWGCSVICAALVAAGCAASDEPDESEATQAATTAVGYGAATTGGGNKAAVSVSTMAAMQSAIDAYDGTSGLVLRYTGVFNFATITDVCAQWKKAAQIVQI